MIFWFFGKKWIFWIFEFLKFLNFWKVDIFQFLNFKIFESFEFYLSHLNYWIWRFRVFNSSSKSTGYFICRWGSSKLKLVKKNSKFQIFLNVSKTVGFLAKAINTCFVSNLSSFQENFELLKSVKYWQSYACLNLILCINLYYFWFGVTENVSLPCGPTVYSSEMFNTWVVQKLRNCVFMAITSHFWNASQYENRESFR